MEGETDHNDSSKRKEVMNKVSLHRLFSFSDPLDHALMFLGSVSAIGHGFAMPLMSVIFGELVDTFGEADNTTEVVNAVSKVALKFLYLAIGSGIAACIQVSCWMVTGERQVSRIRGLYLKTLLRQEIGFFDQEADSGEIMGRMSGDTVVIQEAIGTKVGKCIQLIATFIGGFALAVIKGWQLTLVLLSMIPAVVLAGAVLSFSIEKIASQGQNAYAVAASVIEQTMGSIRTVASFTGENRAIAKYEESLVKAYNSSIKSGFASGLGFGAVMAIVFSTYGLAVWYGGKMILEKGYTGGDVINVIFAIVTGSMALGEVSPCITAFIAGQAAAFKMFESIERKPRIDAFLPEGKMLDDIRGEIELRDVGFCYPSRPHQQIFSGFSLIIPSGTTAALVGGSGSGKSTVISLIERFYDPAAGEVLIDGVNLKEFQLRWIRQKISLVSQEPVLFATSIRQNLLYGKDAATIDEIAGALKLANAAKFINKLPQGLDTLVGEHGTLLSGGQKQRIAIARAILKNPKILLLDEATSALDTGSEKKVQNALDRFMLNRTTVIVAHRLSTVRNVDTIAVIQDGKIIEKGSHSELTRDPDGAYSQLIQLQTIPNKSDQIEVANTHEPRISVDPGRSSCQSPFLQFIWGRVSPQILKENEKERDFTSSNAVPLQKYTMQSISSLWRVASSAKSETRLLILGSVAAVGLGVILPVFGYILSNMIKTFYEPPHELQKDSKYWACIFVTIGVISLVLQPMRTHFFTVAAAKLMGRIRKACFKKVVHMEIGWFDEVEQSRSAVCRVLSEDALAVQSLVADGVSLVIQNAASAIGAVVISFMVNWQLAIVIISLLPFLGVNNYIEFKLMKGFGDHSKKLFAEATQVAHEAVGSIRTVASFCAEDKVMDLYMKKCDGPVKSGTRHGIISGLGFGLSMFLLYSVYATSFYTGAIFVEQGKMSITDVFHVFFVLTMSCVAIAYSSSLLPDIAKARCSAASMFETLDRKSRINSSDESGETIQNMKGEIEFQHVSFKYPSRPDTQIFQNLCLTIQSSQTLALVGESGSGKSTIISLVQRFYDPDTGNILIDGVDIRKMQLKWLRQQMGLVSQEPMLFNDTIRANIAYGKEDNVTEVEIVAAAKLANAHNFICSLAQGYDTIVGERGIQLSGGQKQRVAIARAIIKAPKILLLDEATSALDAESERIVQEALDKVAVNRTTVVVAHRLFTIRGADLIAVVKNGAIAEIGSHESLVNRADGVYASLVALQSGAEPK